MSETLPAPSTMEELRETIRDILSEEFQAVLDDASWRVHQAWDHSKIPAEALNLNHHLLTGYTVTNNSPSGGSIAWSDLHVVYNGTDYGPFSGNTANKYVWFDQDHSTNKIQTSNTKPALTTADAILFVNNSGTAIELLKSQLIHGAVLIDGTVNTSELADAAITANKILSGAVGSTQLGTGAVTTAKIVSGAVTATELGTGAVTTAKIASGAVTSTELGTAAVTSGKIAANAVGSAEIANDAVGTSEISTGAVASDELASNAVTSVKIQDDAVTTAKIAAGAVTSTEILNGTIDTAKLNIFNHLLY